VISRSGRTTVKANKVLVVDDDLNMRIFISALLKTNGYQPLVGKDGREGIEIVKNDRPNLIILDIMMPGEGGVPMYRQLKEDKNTKDIPVIMLSGVESKTFFHSLKMLSVGRNKPLPEPEAYIEKPPKAEELLDMIDSFFKDAD
jgi:CheY-like chemotaxis protein